MVFFKKRLKSTTQNIREEPAKPLKLQQPLPSPDPDIVLIYADGTPILHPNELLLQTLSQRTCGRRAVANTTAAADLSFIATVYVTTERLILVSNNSSAHQVQINALDAMKTAAIPSLNANSPPPTSRSPTHQVELYTQNTNVTTIGFRSASRARSFLKLIANIRFELMIKTHLSPRYSDPCREVHCSKSEPCLCCWEHQDQVLPSYEQSEEAVRLYLVLLNLIPNEAEFDRRSRRVALAAACFPPGSTAAEEEEQAARRRRARRQRQNISEMSGLYNGNEHTYTVPLIWI